MDACGLVESCTTTRRLAHERGLSMAATLSSLPGCTLTCFGGLAPAGAFALCAAWPAAVSRRPAQSARVRVRLNRFRVLGVLLMVVSSLDSDEISAQCPPGATRPETDADPLGQAAYQVGEIDLNH